MSTKKVQWINLWPSKEMKLQAKHKQVMFLLEELFAKNSSIQTICDFGCGQGVLTNEIQKKYPEKKVFGLDNNNFSKEKIENFGIEYKHFDLLDDHTDDIVDVAILSDVLEHFPNPLHVLTNLSHVKYFIIVVPNFSFITERWSVLLGKVPFQLKPSRGGHMFWFNQQTWNEMINDIGLTIVLQSHLYPKKLDYFPFFKRYANLFATSFGCILKRKL